MYKKNELLAYLYKQNKCYFAIISYLCIIKKRRYMNKSILIVDDKPEIAKVITIQLSRDYNVHSEGNPIEALAWMHAGNIPDLTNFP